MQVISPTLSIFLVIITYLKYLKFCHLSSYSYIMNFSSCLKCPRHNWRNSPTLYSPLKTIHPSEHLINHLSQRARSWLLPAFTNIILALKSNCFIMSIRSPASTSGLVSPWDNLQQCSISWWPHTMLLLCRLRMAIHKEELGAWQLEERKTNTIVKAVLQQTAYTGLSFSRPHLFIVKFTAYNFVLLFVQGKKPFKGSCLRYSHHCGIFIIRSFCSQEEKK